MSTPWVGVATQIGARQFVEGRGKAPAGTMGRRHERLGPRKSRIARFEELETRDLLSGAGLNIPDHSSASILPPALNDVPALIGQPLAQPASAPLAEFRLEAEDLNNNPITTARVGEDFKLAAFVQDERDGVVPSPGVWAAYMNVTYDKDLVSLAAAPNHNPSQGNFADLRIEFGDYFKNGLRFGDLGTPGEITGIGSASLALDQPGAGPLLLWRIIVHAGAGGSAVFVPSFDSNPDHETLLLGKYDAVTADQIQFDPLELSFLVPPGNSRGFGPEIFPDHPEDSEIFDIPNQIEANQAITTNSSVQQMPSVAVDPRDSNHVVIAYMDYSLLTTGYAGIGVAESQDGGQKWQYSSIQLPTDFAQGAANPIAKFDAEGHIFVSFMAATFKGPLPPLTNPGGGAPRALGFQANNGIFVSRSSRNSDGSFNWQTPVAVTSHLYNGVDQVPFEIIPDLAIDNFRTLPDGQPNPNYGTLYEVWSRYYPAGQYPGEPTSSGGSNIMIAASRDGGQTWQTQLESHPQQSADPVTVIFNDGLFYGTGVPPGQGFENWSHVTIGPEGDVYVSQFFGAQFAVHHSVDGGRSFSHPDPQTAALFPFGLNFAPFPAPLPNNSFRLQVVRAIVADPARPGYLYVAEGNTVLDAQGVERDEGDVIFARSTDYGATWQTTFQIGGQLANVINDDNDGHSADGSPGEVASGQALPRLVVDSAGNVALIWYDTRRDPADHRLDVFGAISTDGGQSFSRNFRVSDQSFDADVGAFLDATGATNHYLGDFLGLALANQTAYAAWTDTRSGNQDIFFARYGINPAPAPPSDRFEPNDTLATATDLGRVVARDVPKLAIAAGDEDWFRVRTAATGKLTVTATLALPGDVMRLELCDESGRPLATGTAIFDESGRVDGQTIEYPSAFGRTYLVHVLPGPAASANTPARYTLGVRSLTADLGAQAYGLRSDSLAAGDEAFYTLGVAASGSLLVNVTPSTSAQGNFRLEVRDANTFAVLASSGSATGALSVSLGVTKNQPVYLHIVGDAETHGQFTLEFSNLDQFTALDNNKLLIPTASGPSQAALADLNNDGAPDIVVTHVGQDMISVLLNNADGTYQAARNFAVGAFQQGGPFTLQGLPNFHRDLAIADFNRDGFLDVVVANPSSGDVSLLLGNGDGTFQPQRRFDATAAPLAMAAGDLNNDGIPDIAVVDSTAGPAKGGVLLGRGDGSFGVLLPIPVTRGEPFRTNSLRIADVDRDGNNDLLIRDFSDGTTLLLGNGDGSFRLVAAAALPAAGPGIAVADLDGDGRLDVVSTKNNTSEILYALGNGDGTFQHETVAAVGQFPVAVAVADFASVAEDGSLIFGVPDGHPDMVVANNGHTIPLFSGPAEVVVMAGLVDDGGAFAGFSAPVRLSAAKGPVDVEVDDVNQDGVLDVIVVDRDGVVVLFGKHPNIQENDSRQTARDLGTVVHLVLPTLTITPGHEDAWYRLQVPTEVVAGSRDQVLDFSGGFEHVGGAGLAMEVVDLAGHVRGSGERFRIVARQGETLFVHVFGRRVDAATGNGAFTLAIDTLPQLVGVEAQSLLPGQGDHPGGPTTSLVLVFQGDRLNASSAEDPKNYHVFWLGPDGIRGTSDDIEVPVGAGLAGNAVAVVYDGSSNVDVSSGRTHPTATRQTVTLLFGQPLLPGKYDVEVSANVVSATFSVDELSLLSRRTDFNGHPVVSIDGANLREGVVSNGQALVQTAGTLGDLSVFAAGTRFLTQFHNDLGALLDAQLSKFGDETSITRDLLEHIVARFSPALGSTGQRLVSLAILFLDPVDIGLVDPDGRSFTYDLKDGSVANGLPGAFVEVGGNVEVVVIPNPTGSYALNVADVPSQARGGLVFLGVESFLTTLFTESLRQGTSQFILSFPTPALAPDPPIAEFGSIVTGITAMRGVVSQVFVMQGLSEVAASPVPSASRSAGSVAVSQTVLARNSFGSGPGPAAEVDAIKALDELFSEIWSELRRSFLGGFRGQGSNADSAPSAESPLIPWWRTITRFFEGERKRNESRASSQPQRGSDSHQMPHSTPTSDTSEPMYDRAAVRFDSARVPLRVSNDSAAAMLVTPPAPISRSPQQSEMPVSGADSQSALGESSADGDVPAGNVSGATSS